MSVNLWKLFLEDDVGSFRQYLANATYSAAPQRAAAGGAPGNATSKIGSPGHLATSPRTPTKSRKSFAQAQSASGAAQSTAGAVLTRADVNAKDGFGRTLLHHIASSRNETAHEFASALLEIPFLDLYAQDAESGWTALHRALYFGNVSIAQALMLRDIKDATDYTTVVSHAHAGGLIKIKDHEGNSPFEVFGLTIAPRSLEFDAAGNLMLDVDTASHASLDLNDDEGDGESGQRHPLRFSGNVEGDEVFAFGSNKNLTLGLGDEDDRQYPERLVLKRPPHLLRRLRDDHEIRRQKALPFEDMSGSRVETSQSGQIPAVVQFSSPTVQDVVMSKLHSAILTNDPISNLYMCGFGKGGRLGTGDEATQYSFVCLQTGGLTSRRVSAIALGQDHSIAVTAAGEVFSWGGNRYGQLGYSLPEAPANETPSQLVPKQLYGHVKREAIIGAAASSIHSAIYTSTALYTFGKNDGQLGLMDADAGSLDMQVIPRRVGVSVLQSTIKSVSAMDRATCVLLDNHEVVVFTHYGFKKVEFPLYTFRNYGLSKSENNSIHKITTGGNTICAVSTFGEVFTIDVPKCESPSITGSTTNPNKARNALGTPSRVWSIKKGHMCAIDVAVGQDGSIILCTESGSVWRKEKRAKIKLAAVRDAGAARTKDYKFVRIPNLTRAVAVRSNAFGAFVAIRRDCHVTREQIVIDPPALWDDMFSLLAFHSYKPEENEESAEPQPRFWTPAVRDYSPAQIKRAILQTRDAEEDLKQMMAKHEPLADSPYDLWITSNVTDVRIPVHSFLIKSRSSILRHALAEFQESYYFSIPDVLSIEYDADGQVQMQFAGADFLTIINLVFYCYTENIIDVWHHIGRAVHMGPRFRQIRTELMKIATHLELRHLERAVRVMTEPVKALKSDMETAIRDQEFFSDHDILIDLADYVEIPAHSVLLCARCPFFDGLFRGRAEGRWMAARKGDAGESAEPVKVDLTHIDAKTFEIVLRHIYADTSDELFDDIATDNLDTFVDRVIEVMSVANELMLDRLAQICQMVLGKFVTTRNICSLLNTASECSVEEFKHVGLEYIGLNLENMLEHRLLEELDPDLLHDLDETVQSNQLAFMPFFRSTLALQELLEQYPDLARDIEEGQKRRVDSMRLRTRFNNDDEDRPTSSRVRLGSYNAGSYSPRNQQRRRSSSRPTLSPEASPAIQPKDAEHDLPFEMDDESSGTGLGIGMPSSSIRPSDKSYPVSPSLGPSEWHDHRGRPISESFGTDTSSLPFSLRQAAQPSPSQARTPAPQPDVRIEGFGLPGAAWKARAPSSFKTDLRDIMSQASSSQTSSLTQAMHTRAYETVKPAKLSQKERKKLQQQQQEQLHAKENIPGPPKTVAGAAQPATPAGSPWQKVEKIPKPSLKDVMAEPTAPTATASAKPVPRTTMTMRQTVSGTSPNPPKQQLPSVSTPNVVTHSSKLVPPQIQSVRHIPVPSSSSFDAVRSMAEILAQQDLEKRAVKEAVAKRSLQEIQQEQEFQQWWDGEEKRLRDEEQSASVEHASRGRGKGGRGRAGRGRGRGGTAAAVRESTRGRGGKRATTSST